MRAVGLMVEDHRAADMHERTRAGQGGEPAGPVFAAHRQVQDRVGRRVGDEARAGHRIVGGDRIAVPRHDLPAAILRGDQELAAERAAAAGDEQPHAEQPRTSATKASTASGVVAHEVMKRAVPPMKV